MRRALLVLSLLAVTLTLGPAAAFAHGKMHCGDEVGFGVFDPIVFPGQEPAGHEHLFLANPTILNPDQRGNATAASLVGTASTCQNTGDTAAYWIPALYQQTIDAQGQHHWDRLAVKAFIAYYRSWEGLTAVQTGRGNQPYPPDLRMVAGNGAATGPQPKNRVNWTCNENSSRPGPWADAVEAACDTATGTVRLGVHLDFPTCWTGTLNEKTGPQNTADFTGRDNDGVTDQLAYATGPRSARACPAGFPVKLPYLRMTVQFLDRVGNSYAGDGRDLALSSGPQDLTTGELLPGAASQWTLHGDFLNAWEPAALQAMIDRCVTTTSAHYHGDRVVCGA